MEIAGYGGWSRRQKMYSGSAASGCEDALLDPASDVVRIRAMLVRPRWARRGIGRASCSTAAEGFQRFQLVAMRSSGTLYDPRGCGPGSAGHARRRRRAGAQADGEVIRLRG